MYNNKAHCFACNTTTIVINTKEFGVLLKFHTILTVPSLSKEAISFNRILTIET